MLNVIADTKSICDADQCQSDAAEYIILITNSILLINMIEKGGWQSLRSSTCLNMNQYDQYAE